jgi:hypothetical protein
MPLRMRALRAPSKIASRVGEDLLALLSVAYGNQRGVIEQQRNRMDRCHGESHGAIPQWAGSFVAGSNQQQWGGCSFTMEAFC